MTTTVSLILVYTLACRGIDCLVSEKAALTTASQPTSVQQATLGMRIGNQAKADEHAAERSLPLGVAYMARKLGHDLEEEADAALEQTGDSSCTGESGPAPRGAAPVPPGPTAQRGRPPHRCASRELQNADSVGHLPLGGATADSYCLQHHAAQKPTTGSE